MLLYILATFCLVSVRAFDDYEDPYIFLDSEENVLSWPESYTLRATRTSLYSNIEEDFTVWKTNSSSRVDCNHGSTKVIASPAQISGMELPMKFEIHPVTTEEFYNEIKCHFTFDGLFESEYIDDILPDMTGFQAVGNETVKDGIVVTKFENIDGNRVKEIRKTVWASYSDESGWTPIKYEYKKFNNILGDLVQHEIWNFFDFYPDVFDDDVFDPEKFGCDISVAEQHTADSERVTKELLFINPYNDKHVDHVFDHFRNKYNKQYGHEHEHEYRKSIFMDNMRLISSVNRRNLSYKLGVNEFSDWTPEEKQKTLGLIPRPKGVTAPIPFPYDEDKLNHELDKVPKEYDMRLLGLISPIKHQEKCGSCWTFAAAAVMEGALARVNGGKVLSLSSQAMVDCAYEGLFESGGGGCNGGLDTSAYNFLQKHGMPTDEEYGPYKMRNDFCKLRNMTKLYSIKGYTDVTKYGVNAIKVAMFNHGPLYISVHVSKEFFQYSSGIFYQTFDDCNPEWPNHAVAMVGYGEEDGELFWIIKNSYGPYWGEEGYIRISARENVCGVATNPSYPVL